VLDALLDRHDDWQRSFSAFEQARRENTDAIATMALENYTEMRDTVLDATYLRRKRIAMALERSFPERFIPRYSMVMFHPEIPYAEALRRGALQTQLLQELDSGPDAPLDLAQAGKLLSERLPRLY
jgi:kynurenine 3-monooxygenase